MAATISIIVPVYNVENYIEECLESVIHQTFRDLEIILIDDGSTDKSGEICDEYARKDARIHVIHQKNSGLSFARNVGIDRATGDYLMFVDSDDYVTNDFCEALYKKAVNSNADIVIGQYIRIENGQLINGINNIKEGMVSGRDALLMLVGKKLNYTVWDKLYKRRVFDHIRFPNGKNYEDHITSRLFLQCAYVYIIDKIVYYYRVNRAGSITAVNSEKSKADYKVLLQGEYKELLPLFVDDKSSCLLSYALDYFIGFKPNKRDPLFDVANEIIRNNISCWRTLTWYKKILLVLYFTCTPLFNAICIKFKKRL